MRLSTQLGTAVRATCLVAVLATSPLRAADTPPPPDSPLRRLVGRLAEKRPAREPAAAKSPTKAELLRPEFRFKPANHWLFLPELAKQLSSNETERAAVYELFDRGAREANRLLATEGADNEVAAATAFFMSQLWQFARQRELPGADVDALHAQIVAALAGPGVAAMSDADKQRYWEYCIGLPVFVLGMAEVVTEESAKADLRTIAAAGFDALLGVKPDVVDIGPNGLVVRAGLLEAVRELERKPGNPTRAAPTAAEPTHASGGTASGIVYTAPAGWSRENANWATIFRATLFDVKDNGEPEVNRAARHAGSIFVLPARAMTGDAHATFDAVWREQFATFELGDTIVHYRARVKCGLVIHYMGRFFHRKGDPVTALKDYAVLYLVDLGGGRVQPITAIVVPSDPGLSMGSFKEGAAYSSLSWPLAALLNSIQPANGAAPYPAGGYFAPADFVGNWSESSSAVGGEYVNTVTGASAGIPVLSSGGTFRIRPDGTYDYSFSYSRSHPQFGNAAGTDKHSGRYQLDGDIFLGAPSTNLGYKFTYCAVGIGTRQTPAGLRRILVLVGADSSGGFRAPPLVPNWDSYAGMMTWHVEK